MKTRETLDRGPGNEDITVGEEYRGDLHLGIGDPGTLGYKVAHPSVADATWLRDRLSHYIRKARRRKGAR